MSILSKTAIAFVLLSAGVSFIVDYTSPAMSNTSSAPAGRTGSPGDGSNCTNGCHAGTATTQAGMITSTIPGTGYLPGQTYTVTGTVSMAGKVKFGFEISPQNTVGTKLGTVIITDVTKTQVIGSGKYVTHKTAGTSFSSGTATWSFDWTAPAAGTGAVTFYGAFNISNNANNSSGDIIRLSSLTVAEDVSAGINDKENAISWNVYPNPASTFISVKNENNIAVTDISINDISGKLVKKFTEEELKQNEQMDIEELATGIYVMSINSAKGTSFKKFIKK